ncbi:MAG: hypothetical protein P1S60_18055, partial [Anaerolineae bacterium]|nr:hypothetical protein [Anaerolineae bacterium]
MAYKQEYLDYIRQAGTDMPGYLERSIHNWRENFEPNNTLFGYGASGAPAAAAAIDAFLYEVTGDMQFAVQAKHALLLPRQLAEIFPKTKADHHPEYHLAVPPMDGLFVPPNYIPAYERIRHLEIFSPADHQNIESIVADSLHTIFHFPEWGAHNRTMLRALSLALAYQAFPGNTQADAWLKLSEQLAEDSWGRWSIEDAMGYHAVWLLALFTYAEVNQRSDFYYLPATVYYINYFTHLLTPLDTFPDFGDCNWGGGAERLLPCFEKAAAVYRDPKYKYIAERMFQHIREAGPPSVGNALYCIQAYAWCDDDISLEQPTWESGEVLDDLVGKKVLFRSGWEKDATYLLLNYRDELGYGAIPRQYLRTTLAVSAEKMHHGHADENAIVLLLNQGTVLLHEGGYRERLPNGRYRADIYHNRVIWRSGIKPAGQSAWNYPHNDGHYKVTRTQKLHFARFNTMEFSRTQVTDQQSGVEWDRILVYLKHPDCFIVIDALKALKAGPYTFSNILYTTDILNTGDNYIDSTISHIGNWHNPNERALLIAYPLREYRPIHIETVRRHYQEEKGLFQVWTGRLNCGDIVPFVTVLWPHNRDLDVAAISDSITLPSTSIPDKSMAVQINLPQHQVIFGCKLDLNIGLISQETRPRYTYEAGKVVYGDFETDATHFYAELTDSQLTTAFTEATGLTY